MAGMFKGLYNFKQTRIEMLRCGDYNELMLILDRVSEQWGETISED